MPSIWENLDHVFGAFQGLFYHLPVTAKRCAGNEVVKKSQISEKKVTKSDKIV